MDFISAFQKLLYVMKTEYGDVPTKVVISESLYKSIVDKENAKRKTIVDLPKTERKSNQLTYYFQNHVIDFIVEKNNK